MNAFADTLFTLLFGWVKALMNSLWGLIASGHVSAFLSWLGDHWALLAAVLVLACSALDYAVWLVRWRPYLVWRTKLRRLFARLRGESLADTAEFQQGYQTGVGLQVTPAQQSPAEAEEPAYTFAQPAPYAQDFSAPAEDAPYAVSQYPQQPAWAPEGPPAEQSAQRRRYFASPAAYTPPPACTPSRLDRAFDSDMPAARRKRRSEKYEHKKLSFRERLLREDDDENLLDGLPPVVDRDQAFHQPVYPDRPDGQNLWRRPEQTQQNGQRL